MSGHWDTHLVKAGHPVTLFISPFCPSFPPPIMSRDRSEGPLWALLSHTASRVYIYPIHLHEPLFHPFICTLVYSLHLLPFLLFLQTVCKPVSAVVPTSYCLATRSQVTLHHHTLCIMIEFLLHIHCPPKVWKRPRKWGFGQYLHEFLFNLW